MKSKWTLSCALLLIAAQAAADEPAALETQKGRLSYSIGVSIGKNLKNEQTDVDLNLLTLGLKNSLANEHLLMTDTQWRGVLNAYRSEMSQRAKVTRMQQVETNRKKSDAFLAEHGKQKDVVILPSGVQYTILKAGNGEKPVDSSVVQVNYRGTKIDGSQFDATEPDRPARLKLAALIPGWKETLKLMPAGSKWQIVIPPKLAYGERGAGSDIGPNETLIFDVELTAIE